MKILLFVGYLISSALGNIGIIIDDISGMGSGDLAKARELAKGYANGNGELRYPSTAKDDFKLFAGTYTPPVLPNDKKGKYVYGLAIFSDDGCDVTVAGKKVHARYKKGQALPDHARSFYVLPCLLTPGKPVEITVNYSNTHFITNGPQPDIDGCSLFVFLTEAPVDMDVDSDNNNGYGSPDRTQAEDSIEEKSAKVIVQNSSDSDNDGLPDYADGFSLEGYENSQTVASSLKFVPVKVQLKGNVFDPMKTKVKFIYSKESEPQIGKGLRAGNEGEAPVMVAKGGMRLWNAPADERKNANPVDGGGTEKGDYIPSGKEVKWADIVRGSDPRETTLYVEYVDIEPPSATGVISLVVEVYQEGKVVIGGESVTIPAGLRVDQRDEVKVIVHSVTGAEIDPVTGDFIKPKQPLTVVTEQQIKNKLYEVFSRQINAWFSDLEIVEHTVDWDIAMTSDWGTPEFPITGNEIEPYNRVLDLGDNTDDAQADMPRPEESKLLGLIDSSTEADLHVFLIGGCFAIQSHVGAGSYFLPGFDRIDVGIAKRNRNVVYLVTQDLGSKPIHVDEYLTTIAHEIGHLLVGTGHPDHGGGVAPLAGTAHEERLMYSSIKKKKDAGALYKNLLVKAEWDAAETWLIAREVARNQGGGQ